MRRHCVAAPPARRHWRTARQRCRPMRGDAQLRRGWPRWPWRSAGRLRQRVGDPPLLVLERLRHARTVLVEVAADPLELATPAVAIEAEQFLARLVGQRNAVEVDFVLPWQCADRGFHRSRLAVDALDHPFQHAQVVAETGPEELAAVAL